MKKIIFLILLLSAGCLIYYFQFNQSENLTPAPKQMLDSISVKNDSVIRVVFYQDVSGSTKLNGVELITSAIFKPYFENTNRSIELYFGCINSMSSQKLLSLLLPSAKFYKPPLLASHSTAITNEQRDQKEVYLRNSDKYKSDSIRFYDNRRKLIAEFCFKVDSELVLYRTKLASHTDLTTTIAIADKVFNSSVYSPAVNFLILNSDGLDSYKREVRKMKNKSSVILVNANAITHTSIDRIISYTFQSSEQAITFTLKNSNN